MRQPSGKRPKSETARPKPGPRRESVTVSTDQMRAYDALVAEAAHRTSDFIDENP